MCSAAKVHYITYVIATDTIVMVVYSDLEFTTGSVSSGVCFKADLAC